MKFIPKLTGVVLSAAIMAQSVPLVYAAEKSIASSELSNDIQISKPEYATGNMDNNEQDRANIEKTFMDLMNLANSMNQEEKRYVREGFTSDEELSLYDMLFNENLSKEDINKIKKVAVDLLEKIKDKISELDHWTEKQETRDDVETYIGAILWEELPESYSDNAIFAYRQKIYEYVFMRYKEVA